MDCKHGRNVITGPASLSVAMAQKPPLPDRGLMELRITRAAAQSGEKAISSLPHIPQTPDKNGNPDREAISISQVLHAVLELDE
ncbi:hypothetical protein DV515_00011230 [Chloebia gouldiae]|uniref:Uncharacterized protein n=1 Tax=Chloebia gouldiae TaxID=44316 RepID=A0A3L8S8C1_CHLGU|nr:hypothetical protein DV515_00011230 [Chloebia gouldiae]